MQCTQGAGYNVHCTGCSVECVEQVYSIQGVTCIVHYKSKFMGPFHRRFMGQGVGCSGGDRHGTGPVQKKYRYREKESKKLVFEIMDFY